MSSTGKKLFLLPILAAVIGLVILLAFTNPFKADYVEWFKKRAAAPKPNIPNDEVLARLMPGGGWRIEEKELVTLSRDLAYLVVGASRLNYDVADAGPGHLRHRVGQVFALRWMKHNADNPWLNMWQSPEVDSWLFDDSPLIYGIFSVQSEKAALAVFEFNLGGAKGISRTMAFVLSKDDVRLHKDLIAGATTVETADETITITSEEGKYILSLNNNEFAAQKMPLSEMTEPGAVEAHFLLGSEGVVAASNPVITVSVGDTVAFVPQDKATAEAFDAGRIAIYTDAWNGPPLSLSEANRLKVGNSYTFTRTGLAHFHISHGDYMDRSWGDRFEPKPTFTVMVMPPG